MAPGRRHQATAMACFLALLVLCVAPAHGAHGARVSKAQAAASSNATMDEYLAAHNQARAAVGVAPLLWSAGLEEAARNASQKQRQSGCGFADMDASPYGSNQGWASFHAHPAEVVASWVRQGRYYNHDNNTCAGGQQCGTYTQVVWRLTAAVGCAQASCPAGATLTICLYDPHGNVQGQSPY